MATNLSLIVLRTQKIKELKKFYEILGLEFVREKHGDGPIHYSCKSPNSVVFELYPTQSASDVGRNRLEFTTHQNLADLSDAITGEYPNINHTLIFNGPSPESLIVHDPEGRSVVLNWKKSDTAIW